MEGLFNERLQVRTRHLEERVGILTKQLAALKEDNARLLKSHSDATHKVQSLEGDLKSERDRCHKLSVTLSSCRRNVKKKILRLEEGHNDYFNSDPASSRLLGAQCGCAIPVHYESLKYDQNYQLLPNYMGIMPARLNHKLIKLKKVTKNHQNHDGQVDPRRAGLLNDMGDLYQYCHCGGLTPKCDLLSCADCCRNVEIFLAQRLHLNDHAQQEYSTKSGLASQSLTCKRKNQSRTSHIALLHQQLDCHMPHKIAYKDHYSPFAPKQPVDQTGIINTSTTSENSKQDLQSVSTLSADGFYVRMENAKADHHQQDQRPASMCGCNRRVDCGDECFAGSDYHSLQYVQALKVENEALRGALLSNKKIEIQELESELQDIKRCASSGAAISSEKSDKSHDKSDVKVIYEQSRLDPIKFLDSLHDVEDKILQKKIAILGLECAGADMGDATKADTADKSLDSEGVHMKAHLNEDLRHLLKALARDVVLLRQENQWLKQKCHDVGHLG